MLRIAFTTDYAYYRLQIDCSRYPKTVIGRSQGTSAFAEVLFIWLQSS
nr:MAG TPA: hypothetical protein [Caudoviricetes sp.]DAT74276.1 MAG TPA: hypothetical protein [Caudoviricetes sp.]